MLEVGVDVDAASEGEQMPANEERHGAHAQGAKIFRINACLWWVAYDLKEALLAASREYQIAQEELLDERFPPAELSALEMMTAVIAVDGEERTFWLELHRRLEMSEQLPMEFGRTTG